MTYYDIIYEILSKAKRPLSGNEIWQEALNNELDKKLTSIGKTPFASILAKIYVDMKTKGENSVFMFASKRPTTFWLKARANELESLKTQEKSVKNEVNFEKEKKYNERNLHPLLVKFLAENLNFKSNAKTIYHEKSKKSESGKDKWNYPDIVGVSFYFDDFDKETLTFLQNTNQSPFKLYSFELKVSLNFSNLKECYFQAVSNSSWANVGYLVVFNKLDGEILEELRRLNQSFGIGVIELNSEVLGSQILLSAKERELDLQTLNMLVEKNKDFKEFINDINKSVKISQVVGKFDEVFDEEKMQNHIKTHNISKDFEA